MKRGTFSVSSELLARSLQLPAGTEVVEIRCKPGSNEVEFTVDHESLPESDKPTAIVVVLRRVDAKYELAKP